jgi:hypothetical protein
MDDNPLDDALAFMDTESGTKNSGDTGSADIAETETKSKVKHWKPGKGGKESLLELYTPYTLNRIGEISNSVITFDKDMNALEVKAEVQDRILEAMDRLDNLAKYLVISQHIAMNCPYFETDYLRICSTNL